MARERDPDRQLRLFSLGPYGVSGSGPDPDSGSRSAGDGGFDPERWKPVIQISALCWCRCICRVLLGPTLKGDILHSPRCGS